MWWQGHPYSLSALPRPPYIRVTIKGLGDQSRAAARLRPGTRVAIEGPYGTFTDHARIREGVALFAAGVGITPVRALLEDLPAGVDVVVVARASTPADLVFRKEVATLVRQRRGRLHELVGSRHEVPLNARALRSLVPDIAYRDLYICGPDGFSAEIAAAALLLGADAEQIHTETFGF
jgi:ferredoxin-NADP reductase